MTNIFYEFKSWFLQSKSINKRDEFERLESKHTRIRYDRDIHEMIRVN